MRALNTKLSHVLISCDCLVLVLQLSLLDSMVIKKSSRKYFHNLWSSVSMTFFCIQKIWSKCKWTCNLLSSSLFSCFYSHQSQVWAIEIFWWKKAYQVEKKKSCWKPYYRACEMGQMLEKNQRICHKYYRSLLSNIDSIYSAHRRNDLTVFIKNGDIAQAILCAISSTMFKNNWVKLRPWNRFVHFGLRSAKSKRRQQQQPKLNRLKPHVIMYMRCVRERAEF